MGVVGTNFISFLRGWSAFHLVMEEDSELMHAVELEDGIKTHRIAIKARYRPHWTCLQVPESLRAEHHHEDPDENFAQLRKVGRSPVA